MKERVVNPQRVTRPLFDLHAHLRRETNEDVLFPEPGKLLTFRERLRRKRAIERIPHPGDLYERYKTGADHLSTVVSAALVHAKSSPTGMYDLASHVGAQEEMTAIVRTYVENLPETRDRAIVLAQLAGNSINAIAQMFELSPKRVSSILATYRENHLSGELLRPIGLKRVGKNEEVNEPRFVKACEERVLASFKILNIPYVSNAQLVNYQERSRFVDQTLIDQGFQLAKRSMTQSEYEAIRRNKPFFSRMVKKYGLWYIKTADLEDFRKNYQPRKKDEELSPELYVARNLRRVARVRRKAKRAGEQIVNFQS